MRESLFGLILYHDFLNKPELAVTTTPVSRHVQCEADYYTETRN